MRIGFVLKYRKIQIGMHNLSENEDMCMKKNRNGVMQRTCAQSQENTVHER